MLSILNKEQYEPDLESLMMEKEPTEEEEEPDKSAFLVSKVKFLEGENQKWWVNGFKETDMIAWDIHDLEPARVPMIHSFEATYYTPILLKACQVPPRHIKVLSK